MAIQYSLKLEGIEKLQAAFRNHPKAMAKELGFAMRRTIFQLERDSKKNAPADTGKLRQSISGKPLSALSGELSARVNYATYVHEGTSRMKARPFFKEAIQMNDGFIEKEFSRAIDQALKSNFK